MRILVLCTGNSCRSQMAEGFFRAYGNDSIEVFSAGLEPGGVNPLAVKVMAEIGIDISGHTSNNLNEYLETAFDCVITVCDNAAKNCPVFLGTKGHPERSLGEGTKGHPERSLGEGTKGHPERSLGEGAKGHPERSLGEGPSRNSPEKNTLRVHWPILDPASALKSSSSGKAVTEDEVLQVFRKIRDEIGEKIKAWLKTGK